MHSFRQLASRGRLVHTLLPTSHDTHIISQRTLLTSHSSISHTPLRRTLVKNAETYRRNVEKVRSLLLPHEGGKVELSKDEKSGVAVIHLNHIDKRNAMSGKMMVELADVVDELATWPGGRGVILMGLGGTFCSGGDLDLVRNMLDPDKAVLMSLFMQRTLVKLLSLPLVSVALIQGKALGGGAELCLATDFRLMTEEAEVAFVHGQMGVSTGWGGGTRLVQLVGPSTALHLLTTGRHLSASEAIELGLANLLVKADEEPLETGKEWLNLHTQHLDVRVLGKMKEMVVSVADSPGLEESMNKERDVFYELWGGKQHQAALEKRKT